MCQIIGMLTSQNWILRQDWRFCIGAMTGRAIDFFLGGFTSGQVSRIGKRRGNQQGRASESERKKFHGAPDYLRLE